MGTGRGRPGQGRITLSVRPGSAAVDYCVGGRVAWSLVAAGEGYITSWTMARVARSVRREDSARVPKWRIDN